MWQLSAAAQAALSKTHEVALLASVYSSAGVWLADLDIIAGQVAEDETAATRRTCAVTLATTSLVPAAATDLLHPLSGNELYLYRGVKLSGVDNTNPAARQSGGTLAPLGIFRLTTPKIIDSGNQLLITLTGNDRSWEIARRSWTGPYTAAAGQTVGAAIQAIINSRWTGPALTYNFSPSTVTVPAGTVLGVQFTSSGVQNESGSTSGGNNPWADCVALAKSAGCELFFDRQGVVVMRPIPTPGTLPSVLDFVEGDTCTMTQLERTLDETTFRNEVVLIGLGTRVTNPDGSTSPGAPVVYTASSTDPVYGPGGSLGARPAFITDQTVADSGAAEIAANAQLPLVQGALDDTAFQAVCNPALDAGDTIFLQRARMEVSGTYIPSKVTHPLDMTSAMQVTNRAYLVAAA